MAFLFESFEGWKTYCSDKKKTIIEVVLEYEQEQKNRTEKQIWEGLGKAWEVMKDAA